jgi:hypothetical protein
MNKPLIEYLPSFMQNSKTYEAIFGADEAELIEFENSIEDLELQLNIDTATWALEIYEKDLGIKTDTSKSLYERRSVIKSKERGTGKVDADLIKKVVDAYANGDADVDFNDIIYITFTSVLGRPPNLGDLTNAVEGIKPAHLAVEYLYKYLVIAHIDETMTIEEVETQPLTNFAPFEPIL